MYGFSGYGTNAYASERQETTIIAPIVRLAMLTVQNAYNVSVALMLKFKQITLEL